MARTTARATYIGGPTLLLELAGIRFLTDPTFDPAGSAYPTPAYTLEKTQSPALTLDAIGRVDVILLSHDHHFDNLDRLGRTALERAGRVYTTAAGAERLGGAAIGLRLWEEVVLNGGVRLIATPARHGPPESDRGPVVGFMIRLQHDRGGIYISGDTVWYDGVREVGRRFQPRLAVLNLGAARVAAAGPAHLTFIAAEAVELARAWPGTTIVPLHFEGWKHFTEGRREVMAAFEDAGLTPRLQWLAPGITSNLSI